MRGRQAEEAPISAVETIPLAAWRGPFAVGEERPVTALESGKVLFFPKLEFPLAGAYGELLADDFAPAARKNISYDPASGVVKGAAAGDRHMPLLRRMMGEFSDAALRFVTELCPRYAAGIARGRASYRPVEIAGRHYSPRKDDRLLHVDAFPSTPTRGRRILRLFCNVNPAGEPRLWHLGRPFAALAEAFWPRLPPPMPATAWLLAALGVTRGRRSRYDQLMLALHDRVKQDASFQAEGIVAQIAFPAGSSWLCFTDAVVHAALAGQYALEQTFYLDLGAMADPERAPLRVLERLAGRRLS
jgi:hypothetical protein